MQKNNSAQYVGLFALLLIFAAVPMLYAVNNALAGQTKDFMQGVKLGKKYYETPLGANGKSCETCHTIADITGKGIMGSLVPIPPFPTTYYPKFKKANVYLNEKIPYSIQDQLRHCILRGEDGFKYGPHSKYVEYLYLYLAYISNGHKINISIDKNKSNKK